MKPKNTPLFIAADSSSFVILDKNKFSGEGFEITKGKKDFIIVGLPYVDNEEIQNYGEYVIKVLPKFFGESRIEISDSNLVTPKLSDQKSICRVSKS